MNNIEFKEWLRYHGSLFAGVASWIARIPKVPADHMPSQRDILDAWERQLRSLPLADAKAASDTMAAQPDEQQPRAADRHPAAILAIAKRARTARGSEAWRPHYVDGQETFRCPTCRDTGAVTIWDIRSMEAARDGKLGQPFTLYSIATRCICDAGSYHRYIELEFNARCMLPILPGALSEQTDRLLEFVAGAVPQGFDDFAAFANADRTEDF